jgi:hypothetical protein
MLMIIPILSIDANGGWVRGVRGYYIRPPRQIFKKIVNQNATKCNSP